MRRLIILMGAMLCFSLSASAQGAFGIGGSDGSPVHPFSTYPHNWEVSIGYQYNRINLVGEPFNTNAVNISGTRFLGNWWGVEGQFGAGTGNTADTTTPANIGVKSVFLGGGPRFAARRHGPIVPWAHVLGGMEHFHFAEPAGMLNSNTGAAFEGGGGVDIHLNGFITVRTELDAIVTHFFSTDQRHFQAVTGLVFGF